MRYSDAVQRLRVPSGFLLAAGFVWLARPAPATILAGLPLSLAGLALRAWAAGHLRKNEELVTSGPYAWIRNPLYAGTLLAAAGCVVAAWDPWVALLAAAVFALVYGPVMKNEQEHLRNLFPGYAEYARRTPLLVPARRYAAAAACSFDAILWRRNREWKAAGAWLLVQAFLWWKALR
jgi:protein-S-isoprenylcysteine O-methyltransferase Ste14